MVPQQSFLDDTNTSKGIPISSKGIPKITGKASDNEHHTSLPERPAESSSSSRRMFIPTRPRAERHESIPDAEAQDSIPSGSPRMSASSSKRSIIVEDSPRLVKKPKKAEGGNADIAPSLLSRMGSSIPNGSGPHINSSVPLKFPGEPQRTTNINTNWTSQGHDNPPAGGYSIRGAAKAASQMGGSNSSPNPTTSSLLERIKGVDLSALDDDGMSDSRKRKRKGKGLY